MNLLNPDELASTIFQGIANQFGVDDAVSDMITMLIIGIPQSVVNQAINRAVHTAIKPVVSMAITNMSMFIPAPLLMYTGATASKS